MRSHLIILTLLICLPGLAQTYTGRITSNSSSTQQPQLYLRNSGTTMSGQQYGYIFSNMAHGIMFQANTSGIDANTASGHMTIRTSGLIGIGTSNPQSILHVRSAMIPESSTNNTHANLLVEATGSRDVGQGAVLGFELPANVDGTSPWQHGRIMVLPDNPNSGRADGKMLLQSRYYNGSSWDWRPNLSLDSKGNAGVGVLTPEEKLHVKGNVLLTGGYTKFIQSRYNVTSEALITGHGQGAGWMINAEYDGSGNPQGNATYTVEAGNYGTSAGYLDFDGNGRRWSFFLSSPSSGIGQPVTFSEVVIIDNSHISLSPRGNETDFRIGSTGKVGIGTDNPDAKLTVAGRIHAQEVKVTIDAGTGPDYVFAQDYDLKSLEEIEKFIQSNKHLPEVPSAKEMEANGVQVGEMNMLLLKKIEELTLHQIEMMKIIKDQQKEIQTLKSKSK
ncbi:MAG: hypothetical protein AAF391_06320 [Bacteroidota bacterium]